MTDGERTFSCYPTNHGIPQDVRRDAVSYGCRHRVSDKLRAVNTPAEVRDRILGHAAAGIGAGVYGSTEVRLKMDSEWMERALNSPRSKDWYTGFQIVCSALKLGEIKASFGQFRPQGTRECRAKILI